MWSTAGRNTSKKVADCKIMKFDYVLSVVDLHGQGAFSGFSFKFDQQAMPGFFFKNILCEV